MVFFVVAVLFVWKIKQIDVREFTVYVLLIKPAKVEDVRNGNSDAIFRQLRKGVFDHLLRKIVIGIIVCPKIGGKINQDKHKKQKKRVHGFFSEQALNNPVKDSTRQKHKKHKRRKVELVYLKRVILARRVNSRKQNK